MSDAWIMYLLGGLCIVLGFVALLTQKTYLDADGKPVDISVPGFGKMKTNYPALVFVAVGPILAAIPWIKTPPVPALDDWVITGVLTAPAGTAVQWEKGSLVPLPQGFHHEVKPTGEFIVQYPVPKGRKIEDFVQALNYTNGQASKTIMTAGEYSRFEAGKPSLLREAGNNSRTYSPVVVDIYTPGM